MGGLVYPTPADLKTTAVLAIQGLYNMVEPLERQIYEQNKKIVEQEQRIERLRKNADIISSEYFGNKKLSDIEHAEIIMSNLHNKIGALQEIIKRKDKKTEELQEIIKHLNLHLN